MILIGVPVQGVRIESINLLRIFLKINGKRFHIKVEEAIVILAIMGFSMIAIFTFLIMSKRMSPIVALMIIDRKSVV